MPATGLARSPSVSPSLSRSPPSAYSSSDDRTLLSLTGWCADILVTKQDVVIGRHETCDARIGLSHISSKHCKVSAGTSGAAGLIIKDLSRNGTYINGERIGREKVRELRNGDTLSLTPPGETSVESVAFVYRDAKACSERVSVFAHTVAGFDVTILKQLGKGAFGEVFLGVTQGNVRAVKVVKKMNNNSKILYEEVKVMDRLRHPHIVGIYNVWDIQEHLVMTLDLAQGGDLEKLLGSMGRLSESDSKSLLVQVLNALCYLHKEKVIHRDLKPENILIKMPLSSKQVPHLLLTDFGLSRIIQENVPMARTICGTPFYIAPEIVQVDMASRHQRSVEGYDERVDLWSTGILLYRLLNGKLPWKPNQQLATQILAAASPTTPITLEVPVSRACRHFLESLVVDKSQRLHAREAIKHEWFEESRRKVAEYSSLFDQSQTQGLQESASDETGIPDRFGNANSFVMTESNGHYSSSDLSSTVAASPPLPVAVPRKTSTQETTRLAGFSSPATTSASPKKRLRSDVESGKRARSSDES